MPSRLETREELNSDLIPIEFDFQSYLQDCIVVVFENEKTIKSVKTPQSLCLENTLNSSNSNKFVSLKTTMLTTKLHTYLSVQSLHTALSLVNMSLAQALAL
jgi:hypothetical protein